MSFDLRGHGKSKKFNKHNDYKIKHFAEDLNFLVQYLKIEKFIIVSHSFGAFVALEFLKNYGQAVTSSVFLSPSYNMKGRFLSSFLEVILWPIKLFDFVPLSNKKGYHIDYSKYKFTGDWNIRRTIADVSNTFFRIYLYSLRELYKVDYEPLLNKINIPVLIVHGKEDSIFPLKNSISMQSKIKDSKLIILEKTDHIIVLNNFEEVSGAIKDFVDLSQTSGKI